MSFEGIDADDRSPEAESDYVAALNYARYESRGEASAEEIEWLHAHRTLWLAALKAIKSEAWKHLERDNDRLRSHPDKPGSGLVDTATKRRWEEIKREHHAAQARRRHFISIMTERINTVRGLISSDPLDEWRINLTISSLLDIEVLLREGDVDRARRKVSWLALQLAKGAEL